MRRPPSVADTEGVGIGTAITKFGIIGTCTPRDAVMLLRKWQITGDATSPAAPGTAAAVYQKETAADEKESYMKGERPLTSCMILLHIIYEGKFHGITLNTVPEHGFPDRYFRWPTTLDSEDSRCRHR